MAALLLLLFHLSSIGADCIVAPLSLSTFNSIDIFSECASCIYITVIGNSIRTRRLI